MNFSDVLHSKELLKCKKLQNYYYSKIIINAE